MRSKLGLPPTGGDILDIISTWEPDRQKWAHDTLAEIERQALEKLKVMPGVQELCRRAMYKILHMYPLRKNVE